MPRKKSTPETEKLCLELEKRGIKAKKEVWDKHKHIDIAIPQYKLNIEVDGPKHYNYGKQALRDLKRNYHSLKKGYVTIHIPNKLTEDYYIEETMELIMDFIEASKKGEIKLKT